MVLPGELRKVSRDGFVHYGGSRYGVPWAWAIRMVEVCERGALLEIRAGSMVIAQHPRAPLAGTTVPLPGQWAGLPMSSPARGGAPGSRAARRGPPPGGVCRLAGGSE